MNKDLQDEALFAKFQATLQSGGDVEQFSSHDQWSRLLEQCNKSIAQQKMSFDQKEERCQLYKSREETLSDVSYISPNKKISYNKGNKVDIVLTYLHGRNKYYFHVDPEIFSCGYFKIAYRATLYKSDVSTPEYAPEIADNTSVVLKVQKVPGFHTRTPIATTVRNGWNETLNELKTLRRFTTEWNEQGYSDKTYNVSHASVLKVSDIGSDGTGMFSKNEYVLVEPYMPSFAKWNWPSAAEKDAKALSIQAFGHYTYHSSAGKLLINDAQGYRDSNQYILTDPYYLYSNKDESTIVSWFKDHECNKFCQSWWRTPKGTHKKELSSAYCTSFGGSGVRATQFN